MFFRFFNRVNLNEIKNRLSYLLDLKNQNGFLQITSVPVFYTRSLNPTAEYLGAILGTVGGRRVT